MRNLALRHAEKIRFSLVGGANTALDFGILFVLVFLGLDKIVSNFISTSVAFCFSFFVNKSFTFKSTSGSAKKQFILFLIITLIGLWVLQPLIISGVEVLLNDSAFTTPTILLIGKLAATAVTLVWNYVLYSKYVFKKDVL